MSARPDAAWLRANDEHLATALHWLRLRLERLADAARRPRAAPEPAPAPAPPPTRGRRRRRGRTDPGPVAALPPAPSGAPTDEDLAAAAAAMADAEAGPHQPALVDLAERFGLSAFERDVLLLGAAVELAPGIGRLCAEAQGDPATTHPTFALAFVVFDDPAWEALSHERPLRAVPLVEMAPGAPLVTSPFRADERVVSYLKGLNEPDPRLAPFVAPLGTGAPAARPSPSQLALAGAVAARLSASGEARPVVQLLGPRAADKQLVATEVARRLGTDLVRVPVTGLPTSAAEIEELARLWRREQALAPRALYLDAGDLAGDPGTAAALARLLGRTGGVRLLDAADALAPPDALPVEVASPTAAEQRAQWRDVLGPGADAVAAALAAQFDLDPVTIGRAAAAARARGDVALDAVWEECLALSRPRLDALAQRIEPVAGWSDLVLPEEASALLRLMVDQVRSRTTVYEDWGVARRTNRGLGITALFAGESGTGKTMAAEVLANDLHLDLYRIDLSAVVSKYIGETEKNLRRVFDAAEGAGTLLFFDEADALFGKRTEVKDSHDRYANIEVNYLLQRMEAYRGLAVLATNRRAALDPAFVRRLRIVVEFPFPDAAHRARIWRGAFAPGVPREPLDVDRLAGLTLSGGSIHNVALDATFAAAAAGTAVTMPLVLGAVGRELRKQGRAVNDADLRWSPKELAS